MRVSNLLARRPLQSMDLREAWNSGEIGALLAQDEGAEGCYQFVRQLSNRCIR
jgi:hypothetical protein